jgi:O-antigen ligase
MSAEGGDGSRADSSATDRLLFLAAIAYLIVDYARPQDLLPLGVIKPGMISEVVLLILVVLKWRSYVIASSQARMVMLYMALMSIHVLTAVNTFYAYKALETMAVYLPFMAAVILSVRSLARLRSLMHVYLCIMLYIAAYSFTHHGVGTGNYFMDENDVSLYMNMCIPMCYFLFSVEPKGVRRVIYGAGMVSGVLTNIVSFSRGGFVGMVCVGATMWAFSKQKMRSFLVMTLLALVVFAASGERYWSRIATAKDTDSGTAAIRLESWKAGWRMFLDNPLGVGGNNFPVRFSEYQSSFFTRGMWGRAAHSIWFTLLPESGIIGVIIYLALLRFNVRDLRFLRSIDMGGRHGTEYLHALSSAFLAAFVGYFVSGSFLSVLYYPHYWYLTAIIVAAVGIARERAGGSQEPWEAAPS